MPLLLSDSKSAERLDPPPLMLSTFDIADESSATKVGRSVAKKHDIGFLGHRDRLTTERLHDPIGKFDLAGELEKTTDALFFSPPLNTLSTRAV